MVLCQQVDRVELESQALCNRPRALQSREVTTAFSPTPLQRRSLLSIFEFMKVRFLAEGCTCRGECAAVQALTSRQEALRSSA